MENGDLNCPECGGRLVRNPNGKNELICEACGVRVLVKDEMLNPDTVTEQDTITEMPGAIGLIKDTADEIDLERIVADIKAAADYEPRGQLTGIDSMRRILGLKSVRALIGVVLVVGFFLTLFFSCLFQAICDR